LREKEGRAMYIFTGISVFNFSKYLLKLFRLGYMRDQLSSLWVKKEVISKKWPAI
jgi:hypothetical protein